MKVTIVGAGNVGSSCAEYILIKQIAKEIILLDIKDGFAEGKALDLTQTTCTLGFKSKALPSAKPSLISNRITSMAICLIKMYSAQDAPTLPAPTIVTFIIKHQF